MTHTTNKTTTIPARTSQVVSYISYNIPCILAHHSHKGNSPHLTNSYPHIPTCASKQGCNNASNGLYYKSNGLQRRVLCTSLRNIRRCSPLVRTLVRKDWGSCVHTPENGDIRATSKQKRSLMTAPAFCLTACSSVKGVVDVSFLRAGGHAVKRKPASRKAGKGTRAVNEVISLGSISSSSTISPHTVRELFPAFQGERRVFDGIITTL